MSTTLGKNIKTYRKNKGLTQEELADLLNVTPQAVSKWESENGLPDVSMLIPLAQALGVSTDALLGYDSLSEQEELIARVRETVAALKSSGDTRDQKALRVSEYLSTETSLNPGCFELINDYVQETANLSMYADPVLENCFPDEEDRIKKLYRDAIRKGVYLISHCSDKSLIEKTHFAVAWIYIHDKDFDNAREHINVLPSIASNRIKEKLNMELTFFESGFENMKGDIKENAVILFDLVCSMLNTFAENYGWWCKDKDEALEICDWCEGIVKAFAGRKDLINMHHYLRARRSIAFFKLVALKKSGDDKGAEAYYGEFAKAIKGEDLTDEEKNKVIELLNNDIAHYSKYC
ncbi:MAG: helix-turn-helix transcriptional regulator [Clostridiales bacterium]|nr:helix-turn-helix transcriptional regulator [Clostridiales bacterium]